ncbi:MAG: thioredoxin domain-containing protein [Micrococcaceae bacterium]
MSTNNSSSREQARKIAQSQIDADRRKSSILRWGVVALAALVLAGLAFFVWSTNKPQGPAAGPANFNDKGGITFTSSQAVKTVAATTVKPDTKHDMGNSPADGKAKITMYVDFMCPGCGQFEKKYKDELKSIVDSGKAEIEYRPIAILDRMSNGTNYSTRALNATACVANTTPNKTWDMITTLYDNQPEENSSGLDDSKLIDLAKQSTGQDISTCVKDGTYKDWAKVVTKNTTDSGLEGTPTVYINNDKWDGTGSLTDAVTKAAKS